MRRIVAAIASLTLITGLVGCSSANSNTPECTPLASSGSVVDSVKVEGSFGEIPTATFPTPLKATKTERKILLEGDGAPALPGGAVAVDFTLYNGETGELIGQTSYDGSDLQTTTLSENTLVTGLIATLQCANAGSQIVSVIAPSDLLDPNGNTIGDLGENTSIVVIADLVSTSLARASGKSQPSPDGMPTVVLDANGVPGITVPKTAPPTKLETAVLIKGDGPVVSAGASVTVHYTGVLWSDGTVFDSSWSRNTSATFSLDGVVPGFAQAIEGQTVGSQILAVIPPELAYGDQDNGTIPPGSTLVFVIDILGTTK
ncbi:FKBP-type peptidyl-prolyl cis-trans isomerase [Aurantimicrobium minutum]|uniref:Peptidyl-prolyl cis-trans isomerase n=1 Tax=Aurantimicrobium minutum TaxID=708131 RepID=A0A173LVW7_9MICO|nr:FKBP-type peptidyl-prolyl cis-trans isomerase [Aurantimicrobium minutum]BAU99136.1 peptidyl-prolyl cis-trans isomerase [Aurantimicrobium minutum]